MKLLSIWWADSYLYAPLNQSQFSSSLSLYAVLRKSIPVNLCSRRIFVSLYRWSVCMDINTPFGPLICCSFLPSLKHAERKGMSKVDQSYKWIYGYDEMIIVTHHIKHNIPRNSICFEMFAMKVIQFPLFQHIFFSFYHSLSLLQPLCPDWCQQH